MWNDCRWLQSQWSTQSQDTHASRPLLHIQLKTTAVFIVLRFLQSIDSYQGLNNWLIDHFYCIAIHAHFTVYQQSAFSQVMFQSHFEQSGFFGLFSTVTASLCNKKHFPADALIFWSCFCRFMMLYNLEKLKFIYCWCWAGTTHVCFQMGTWWELWDTIIHLFYAHFPFVHISRNTRNKTFLRLIKKKNRALCSWQRHSHVHCSHFHTKTRQLKSYFEQTLI